MAVFRLYLLQNVSFSVADMFRNLLQRSQQSFRVSFDEYSVSTIFFKFAHHNFYFCNFKRFLVELIVLIKQYFCYLVEKINQHLLQHQNKLVIMKWSYIVTWFIVRAFMPRVGAYDLDSMVFPVDDANISSTTYYFYKTPKGNLATIFYQIQYWNQLFSVKETKISTLNVHSQI